MYARIRAYLRDHVAADSFADRFARAAVCSSCFRLVVYRGAMNFVQVVRDFAADRDVGGMTEETDHRFDIGEK